MHSARCWALLTIVIPGLGCARDESCWSSDDWVSASVINAGEPHRRADLRELCLYGHAAAERELLNPVLPRRIVGSIPGDTAVVGFYAETDRELLVLGSVEGVDLRGMGIDTSRGDGLLVLNTRGFDHIIKCVARSNDPDNGRLVYTCGLGESPPLDKDMGSPRDSSRNIILRRFGLGLCIRESVGRKITVVAQATAAGESPLDSDPSPARFEEALADGDFLALRRALQAWHDMGAGDEARATRAAKLLSPRDPVNAYWATRYLAGIGRFDLLAEELERANRRSRGLDHYLVSAIFHGVSDIDASEARRFVLDHGLAQKMESIRRRPFDF